jgi:2-dehydro-3-deoxygalactonokinase
MGFATFMTGEFYALLRQHSILARTLPPTDGAFDAEAFDAGVAHAMESPGLLQSAFSVRTLSLFERLPEVHRPSYLSGVVIGEELRSQTLRVDETVTVVGAAALTLRYERALTSLGVRVVTVGGEATWRGLHDIAGTIRE